MKPTVYPPLFYAAAFVFATFTCSLTLHSKITFFKGNAYYVNLNGNDENEGTKDQPWKSIEKLNSIQMQPGDTVFFQGKRTFTGSILLDSTDGGTNENPVIVTSYGNAKAIINADDSSALIVNNTGFIKIMNIIFAGSGRKSGNTKDGVIITNCRNIEANNLNIHGFQKAGLLVYNSKNIEVKKVRAYDNGFAGISVSGKSTEERCSNIHIVGCDAENNPGDPANFGNHSGNGIIAGYCRNVTIEYCTATNNGWDMPRTGNGPVGIWAYEADSVMIQYCISYRNKTSKGGGDGGGFDLDGGVTHSIIQKCLSYENEGSGFGIFQYAGASNWHDNIIRNNISENDGNVSAAGANAFIWNSSRDEKQFKNLEFYNNILYNSKGAAISYASESENTSFRFHDNIFVAKDELMKGKDIIGEGIYLHNDWWCLQGGFNIDGIKSFTLWRSKSGKEEVNGKVAGFNVNPRFTSPGNTTLTTPYTLTQFSDYHLLKNSTLLKPFGFVNSLFSKKELREFF